MGCLNHPVRCVPQGYHRLKNRTVQASPLLHSPLCLLSHRRCLLASCILLLSSTSPPPLTFSHPANSTLTATSVPPPALPLLPTLAPLHALRVFCKLRLPLHPVTAKHFSALPYTVLPTLAMHFTLRHSGNN